MFVEDVYRFKHCQCYTTFNDRLLTKIRRFSSSLNKGQTREIIILTNFIGYINMIENNKHLFFEAPTFKVIPPLKNI